MPVRISSGKVREIYDAGNDRLFIVTSDRISAFDVIMKTPIPGKGVLLNQMSLFWFRFLKDCIPTHFLSADPSDFPAPFNADPDCAGRSMLVKKLKMLPFECIVRGYITGSAWSSYQKTGEICGIHVPAGMQESEKFAEPLFTPSTKAETGHDENVSFDVMASKLGQTLAEQVRDATIAVYTKAAEYALTRGIIIADTKLEFGLDESGRLVLADEVLTPDSSRFWSAEDYAVGRGQASFDKQYLRDWLKANHLAGVEPAPELPLEVIQATHAKYQEAFDRLTASR